MDSIPESLLNYVALAAAIVITFVPAKILVEFFVRPVDGETLT
jgi:hypothetical protein